MIIADDHQMIIDGLKMLLNQESDIEVVGQALNGEEVIDKVRELDEIDVVILDINMPKKDGIEVTSELKDAFPEVKILIVTMYNRPEFIQNLMKVGVDGYILKNSGKDELINALHAVASDEPYYGTEITKTIMKTYQKSRVFNSPMDIEVTDREKEIIRLISEGFSTVEIADKLFLSTHTVNSHRKSILSKLEVKNSAGVIRFGIQSGIVKGFDL